MYMCRYIIYTYIHTYTISSELWRKYQYAMQAPMQCKAYLRNHNVIGVTS